MNVNLIIWVCANKKLTITHSCQEVQSCFLVKVWAICLEEELVAVTVLRTLPVIVELNLNLCASSSFSIRNRDGSLEVSCFSLAGNSVYKALKEGCETKCTRVNNTVLFEDRKKLRSAGNRLICLNNQSVQNLNWGELRLLKGVCLSRNVLQNGKNSALNWLSNSLKSNLFTATECVSNVLWSYCLRVLNVTKTLSNTAKNLRRNNTRVTTSAHQRTVSNCLCNILHACILRKILNLTNNGAQGKGHVSAGVSIWYRENVELVDLFCFVCNGKGCYREACTNDI